MRSVVCRCRRSRNTSCRSKGGVQYESLRTRALPPGLVAARAVGHRRGAMSCRRRCRSSTSATPRVPRPRRLAWRHCTARRRRPSMRTRRCARTTVPAAQPTTWPGPIATRWCRCARPSPTDGASLQRILIGVFELLADSRDRELEVVPDPEVESVGGLARGRHGAVQGRGRRALVAHVSGGRIQGSALRQRIDITNSPLLGRRAACRISAVTRVRNPDGSQRRRGPARPPASPWR